MWLRNYDILRMVANLPAYKFESNFTESQRPYLMLQNGTQWRMYANSDSRDYDGFGNLLNYVWVATPYNNMGYNQATLEVGIEDTPVSYDDFNLKSPLTTSSITKTIVDVEKPLLDYEEGRYTVKISVDFKNITSEDIYVKEWCVFIRPYNCNSSFAIKREVLGKPKRVQADSYCRIDFEYYVDFPPSLKEWNNGDTISDTWEQVVANANAGTVDDYPVGGEKTLVFNYDNTKYLLKTVLIGKDHDTISGTTSKASLTFLVKDLILTSMMNENDNNVGGWMAEDGDFYDVSQDMTEGVLTHGCTMRKFVAGLIEGFPTILQDNIKVVDKFYDDRNGIQKSKDKLWLLCPEEMSLSPSWYRTGQGTLYEAFANGMSRQMNTFNGGQMYWLRSRNTYMSSYQWVSSTGGPSSSNTYSPRDQYGCTYCFCL